MEATHVADREAQVQGAHLVGIGDVERGVPGQGADARQRAPHVAAGLGSEPCVQHQRLARPGLMECVNATLLVGFRHGLQAKKALQANQPVREVVGPVEHLAEHPLRPPGIGPVEPAHRIAKGSGLELPAGDGNRVGTIRLAALLLCRQHLPVEMVRNGVQERIAHVRERKDVAPREVSSK